MQAPARAFRESRDVFLVVQEADRLRPRLMKRSNINERGGGIGTFRDFGARDLGKRA